MTSLSKFARLRDPCSVENSADVQVYAINDQQLPLVFEAAEHIDLPSWVRLKKDFLRTKLRQHGALLMRSKNFPDFNAIVHAFTDSLVDYRGGAAIRSRVNSDTYTASEYPAELEIRLHSEFCYSSDWPMILFFHCAEISQGCGGQTPLGDNRRIFAQMPHDIRRQFADRGLTYVRGYGYNRTWQRSYETESQAEVEAICRAEGRRCEWSDNNRLRTYETRQAIAHHPLTKEEVWFNYAHGFHISRMDDGIREALSTCAEDTDEQLWPNNVYWGDGSLIDPKVIGIVNGVVHKNAVQFDWHVGDTLIVDNMLCSHGRRPYHGERRVLLKMAESFQAEISGRDKGDR